MLRSQETESDMSIDEEKILAKFHSMNDELFGTDVDLVDMLAMAAVNDLAVLETMTDYAGFLGRQSTAYFTSSINAALRVVMLRLLEACCAGIGYRSELVSSIVALSKGPESYWDLDICWQEGPDEYDSIKDPAAQLLFGTLRTSIFDLAARRSPYELESFLEITRAVAQSKSAYISLSDEPRLLDVLTAMPCYTDRLPPGFVGYEACDEDQGLNIIRLTTPLQLFRPRSQYDFGEGNARANKQPSGRDICIPRGTGGCIVSEDGPKVAHWKFEYSMLKYLGKLLDCYPSSSDQQPIMSAETIERGAITVIIELFATILRGISQSAGSQMSCQEETERFLHSTSEGLTRNQDIISCVIDIFEEESLHQACKSGQEGSVDLCCACLHFLHACLPVASGRIWPYLRRCNLLGMDRGVGTFSAIVGNIEVVTSRFNFLVSCTRLYHALIEDLKTNVVRRRFQPLTKNRFEDRRNSGQAINEKAMSNVLCSFTKYLLESYEASANWLFQDSSQRFLLNKHITTAFNTLLVSVYGIKGSSQLPDPAQEYYVDSTTSFTGVLDARDVDLHILAALVPAAQIIVESHLSDSTGTSRYQTIISSLLDAFQLGTMDKIASRNLQIHQTEAALTFLTTLLRVSIYLGMPSHTLQTVVLKASPLIARLYVANIAYRIRATELLRALLAQLAETSGDAPSLLGHMGGYVSKHFFNVLMDFDQPYNRPEFSNPIWQFFTEAITARQGSMVHFFLNGSSAKESIQRKDHSKPNARRRSNPMNIATEKLADIKNITIEDSVEMLRFTVVAQNFWPMFSKSILAPEGLVVELAGYLPSLLLIKAKNQTERARKVQAAAYITEILTMHIFHCREAGKAIDIAEAVSQWPESFIASLIEVQSIKDNAYVRFRLNMRNKYNGCDVEIFRRSGLYMTDLGSDYCFDTEIADSMLQYEASWSPSHGSDGFSHDLRLVNSSLSVIDAQIVCITGQNMPIR